LRIYGTPFVRRRERLGKAVSSFETNVVFEVPNFIEDLDPLALSVTDVDQAVVGEIENQTEILVHQPNRKLWAVVARHRSLQFSHMRRSDDCGLGLRLQQALAIKTGLLVESYSFGNGLHSNSQ
jgi:hypothetical protein